MLNSISYGKILWGATCMPIAYSYIRFSSKIQRKGASFKRQSEAVEQYCIERKLTLDKKLTFFDDGVSAFRGKNRDIGMLGKFLSLVDTGIIKKGSVLILESLDRLTRSNLLEAQNLFNSIILKDIKIVTLIDKAEYDKKECIDKPYILMQAAMVFIRANEESESKSIRVADSWRRKREKARETGKLLTRICPMWLQVKDGKFQVIEEKAALIKRIYEMAADGMGAIKILRTLNSEDIKGFRTDHIAKSTVRRILTNPQVLGYHQTYHYENGKRVPDGDLIKDYFPPIISEELFYKVQECKKKVNIKGPARVINNIFTGIVKCHHCGCSYVYTANNKKKGWTYLSCYNAKTNVGCKAPDTSIRYSVFEKTFFNFVRELELNSILNTDQNTELLKTIEQLSGRITVLKSKIDINRKKIQSFLSSLALEEDDELKLNYRQLVDTSKNENVKYLAELEQLETDVKDKKSFLKSLSGQLSEIKSYEEKLQEMQGDEDGIYALKLKVRSAIHDLVDRIELTGKLGFQVWFKNGSKRLVNNYINLKLIDAKDWKKGFEDKDGKKQLFEVKPEDIDFAKEVLELHGKRKK